MSALSDSASWAGATGVGSLPGRSISEALRLSLGDDLDTGFLPELPARGPGAGIIGRTVSRLVDMHGDLQPSSWRLTRRPGIDARRAADFWSWDLDALEQDGEGYDRPLKLQLAGPWTLAASFELPNGHCFLTDHGAVRDLCASLAEGAAELLAEVRRRLPLAQLVLQLDEPSLPGALAGQIPTASGFGRLPALDAQRAEDGLREVIARVDVPVIVHSCAPAVPYGVIAGSGAAAVMPDLTLLSEREYDALGEAMDAGLGLVAGVVPSQRSVVRGDVDAAASRVREIASAAGIGATELAARVGVTSCCGLAGRTMAEAGEALRAVRSVAHRLRDDPEPSPAG